MLRQLNMAVQRAVEARQQVGEDGSVAKACRGCKGVADAMAAPCRCQWCPGSSSSMWGCTDNLSGAERGVHEQHKLMCCQPEAGWNLWGLPLVVLSAKPNSCHGSLDAAYVASLHWVSGPMFCLLAMSSCHVLCIGPRQWCHAAQPK